MDYLGTLSLVAELADAAEVRKTPCGDGWLTWRVWGSGPPVVLLHGDFGSWTHWIRNIPHLSQHFRILVPDMPGYGTSDMPPQPWSPGSLAQILVDGVGEVIGRSVPYSVAAFSYGGIIAAHLAAIAPEHVAKLVLLGTGGMGLPAPDAAPKLRRIEPAMGSAEVDAAHRHNLAALMIADPAKVDDLAVAIQIANVRHARLRAGGIPASDVLLRVLPRVRARLYGIWGEHDAFARPNIAARAEVLRRFQPDLDFRIIEGAGHWTPYEAPAVLSAALLEMLR